MHYRKPQHARMGQGENRRKHVTDPANTPTAQLEIEHDPEVSEFHGESMYRISIRCPHRGVVNLALESSFWGNQVVTQWIVRRLLKAYGEDASCSCSAAGIAERYHVRALTIGPPVSVPDALLPPARWRYWPRTG
jgi:hypothetical protein